MDVRRWVRRLLARGEAPVSRSGSVIVAERRPDVIRYVDALLASLADGAAEVTICAESPSPSVREYNGVPPASTQVSNRLKVMAGHNPVPFVAPVSSRFVRSIRGNDCRFDVRFVDGQRPSAGTVRIRCLGLIGPAAPPSAGDADRFGETPA